MLFWRRQLQLCSLWMVLRIPTSSQSCPCISPSSSVWTGLTNPVLTNRIGQKWWDVTSQIRVWKDYGFHLEFSLSCTACSGESQRPWHKFSAMWATWKQVISHSSLEMTAAQATTWSPPYGRPRVRFLTHRNCEKCFLLSATMFQDNVSCSNG